MARPTADLRGKTGVLLTLRTALPSIIQLRNPQVSFDGLFPIDAGWGKEFFPLGKGAHEVSCHVQFIRGLRTGEAHFRFEIPEDTVVRLRWTAPILASGKGWWRNLGPSEEARGD